MSASLSDLLDRPIAFHRPFVRIGAGITGAVMLSQAVYWSRRTSDADGWFYKSQIEWEEETGLTRYEQEGARKALGRIGVLEEQRAGVPARLYYRVNAKALRAILIGEIPQTGVLVDPKPDWGNSPNKKGENPQSLTETTTETTTEITSETLPAASGEARQPAPASDGPKDPNAQTYALWQAYSAAYRERYGVPPTWNRPVAGMAAQIVARLGQEEAPAVAGFFVSVNDRYYVNRMHPLNLLLRDCESVRTQWATGRAMTETRARQADRTAANFSAADEAKAMLRQRRNSHAQ